MSHLWHDKDDDDDEARVYLSSDKFRTESAVLIVGFERFSLNASLHGYKCETTISSAAAKDLKKICQNFENA